MPNGVEVQYDGIGSVKIMVPPELDGKICGICGNKDGVRDDADFMKGPHVDGKECPGYYAAPEPFTTVSSRYLLFCRHSRLT